ncbi:MAG: diguanylate cyclase [Mycobacterium sp.]|nr:diguanylate cyclase [Mycobacterium sp.]
MEPWSQSPWRRLGLSARAGWLVLGGCGTALAVIAAQYLGGLADTYKKQPVDEVVLLLCLVSAAACTGWAALSARGRQRGGWLALAAALAAWVIGEAIRLVPAVAQSAYPTPADLVLIVFPLAAGVAAVCLSEHTGQSRWRLVLDGVIVATSLLAVSWMFMLDELLAGAGIERWGVLAHAAADVGLVTVAILMWSRSGPAGRPSLNVVVAGILTICAADIALLYLTGLGGYQNSGIVDLARVAGIGMLALGGLSSINEPGPETSAMEVRSRARLWLPYLPVLAAGGVGLFSALRATAHGGPLFAMVAVLVVSVLARQFVVLVENQGLLSTVARAAFHDSLTGLPNRAQFLERLERALARRRLGGPPVSVLCLDLDKFKAVNDVLGHPAGDELLIRVAGRLTNCVGETWTVARLGGDEFAILIEGPPGDAQMTADRILLAFNASIMIEGVPLAIRPSIGLTFAATEADWSVDELLRQADLAMYAAKREGGGCVRSYAPELPVTRELPQRSESAAVDAGVSQRASADSGPADGTSDHVGSIPRTIWIALGLLIIGLIVFAASTVIRENRGADLLFDNILYPGLTLSAALVVAVRAVRVTTERWAWALLAAGLAASAIGDVVYAGWVPPGQSPSIADPAYVAFYPLMYAGLLLLMRNVLRQVPVSVRLDTLVCGLTAAAVGAALAVGPISSAASSATATVLVGLVYPWGDLLLVAVAAGMLPIIGWRRDFRWIVLLCGLTISALADTVYLFETSAGAYRVGTSLDVCWPAAALLVAMASWLPPSEAPRRIKPGRGSYAVPVICTAAGLSVAVLANDSRVAVALATLGLVAIAARFSVTYRDESVVTQARAHAMTDELTGLPNRRALAVSLTAASANGSSSANRRARCALLLLDLDDFQEINHHFGRHVGDELLCRIANRLSRTVREPAQLVRTGGDEFAVLLEDGQDLPAVRAYAGALLESLNAPFPLDQITVQVDASVAIAMCPGHCDLPTELLTLVESAMPQAKIAKSKIGVYNSADELQRHDGSGLADELSAALPTGQLTCHYQPKINARDGSVHSVEALLRWQHPTRGLLLPGAFLPAAERAGLMRQVTNFVIDLALTQIRSWRDRGMELAVAVNVSTSNVIDLDLVDTIERLLEVHDVSPAMLMLEVKESTLATDSVRSRRTAAAMRRLGVRISLDDYGTGWSSLARLQDVSIDELKLDRVFVARLAGDPRSIAIVRSTVALAHSLGADLVAEGVEDEVTLRALKRFGCNITQGYVHSPPLPADELEAWLAGYTPHDATHADEADAVGSFE